MGASFQHCQIRRRSDQSHARRLAHGTEMVRGKVYFSGTLITSIFNLLLIICLGTHDDTIDSRHDEAYGNGKHNLHGGHRAGEPHGAGAGAEDPAIATAV